MKLSDHVETIRHLIDQAYRSRLGRMGIESSRMIDPDKVPVEYKEDRERMEEILTSLEGETTSSEKAYEKLIEELTFTLFNRLSALKVMEAHILHPEILTRRSQHGNRSFSHQHWLEKHPEERKEEKEGLIAFLEDQFVSLSDEIPLFSLDHPYHLLPTVIELDQIIEALNQVEKDAQVEPDIWKSDDVLGWLYESYNNYKKKAHKESKEKTEYDKVHIQSQVYTPRWVVKFLVDNSLGKLYLEMYPDSNIKEKYLIANAPKERVREPKPLTEIKLIDPATGSGNFLLYAFDLFYDLYLDQIEHYGKEEEYDRNQIPELILEHNLHGIDIDDRAVQLAQLGLYIKAKRRKASVRIPSFSVVSSDFYLPAFESVRYLFENGTPLKPEIEKVIRHIWGDLQQAHRFGSLIRLEEKFQEGLQELEKKTPQQTLYIDELRERQEQIDSFRTSFFQNLERAIEQHAKDKNTPRFLHTKTKEAITFLKLLTQQYDVAVANPPYTDSGDYGPKLKDFVEANYKKPYKFHTNLYVCFMKRCEELVNEEGKIALIHPDTFMFIKSFEDMRKYILNNLYINIFSHYPSSGIFRIGVIYPALYVIEKTKLYNFQSSFIDLRDIRRDKTLEEKELIQSLQDFVIHKPNKHNYILDQSKLKIIDGWPFIYWISDGFREKFKGEKVEDYFDVAQGLITGNNDRFIRFWWEIEKEKIKTINNKTKEKWYFLTKGGPFSKWYGNNWLIVNWENNGFEIVNYYDQYGYQKSRPQNLKFYFIDGITFAKAGSKGASFRYFPKDSIFESSSPTIFQKTCANLSYTLGFLNTSLTSYILDCLNPTVSTQVGDVNRVPFILPSKDLETRISAIASQNIDIKKHLCSFHIIETNFEQTPITAYEGNTLLDRIHAYLNYENSQLGLILIHEAIINELVYEVYELSVEDREQVEEKMGKSVGGMPVLPSAREAYLSSVHIENTEVREYIESLPSGEFEPANVNIIKQDMETLYQANNDLESFCIKHQVNPINVWYWFQEAKIVPKGRAQEIALEFLADAFRTLLQEDEDGIIPLMGLSGEKRLIDRLEEHCYQKGFTTAQFMQLEGLIGRPLQEYLEHQFFKNLSDHLNLFMYLPKTPFIWHLSSEEHQGFECYILIYKWNQDSLYKLKSTYLNTREESLQNRLIQLADSHTAQAIAEKEKIQLQLEEIARFEEKLDKLIQEGYNPILDSGVGKNIAPLQKKGMLRCEVLNSKQLKTYLEADW